MQNNEGLYYLMSTNIVAYVKSKGIKEESVELTDNGKVKYWFKDTEEFQKAAEDYKKDESLSNFLREQKAIKDKIIELRMTNKR